MSIRSREPFQDYGDGTPYLASSKHRKTMSVEWHDGGVGHYIEFAHIVERGGLNEALREVWKRHRPQCSRRAHFCNGGAGGFMGFVPEACGLEAVAVIRAHFEKALKQVSDTEKREQWSGQ